MSRIDEMVQQLCPNGVEYKKLGEMLDYEQPGKYIVSSTDYDDSHPIPVLTAGQSFILGYTDDSEGIYDASKDNPVVLIDDFTTANRWIDFPFKVKSSAAKLLTSKDETQFSLRYLFYLLQMNRYEPMAHSRQWIGTFSQIEVPVPPLDVQCEVVRVLDSFAELEARKAQYAHYRDELLSRESLEAMAGEEVELKKLGEMLDYEQPGKYIVSSTDYNDSYPTPVLTAGQSFILGYTDDSEGIYDASKDNPVVLIDDFTTANRWIDFPFKVKSSAAKLLTSRDETKFSLRYLFYLLQMNRYEPMAHSRQWIGTFSQIEVPVPPLPVQQQVVDILDRFDALTTSLTDGLPAEIEARRQQYEYYRDRLLDLPRKEVAA